MMIKWIVPMICLAFVGCNDARDQWLQKRATKDTTATKDGDTDPDGESGSNSNGGKKSNNGSSSNSERSGKSTKCNVASFKNDLSGSLTTEVTQIITASVSGDADLAIKNSSDELTLDLTITNLVVDAGIASGAAKGLVEEELAKTTGKRTMLPLSDSEYEKLKNEDDEWEEYSCAIGMIKEYTFPIEGGTATVSFDPALPFAPYPDQVDAGFLKDVKQGITFSDIAAKVISVNGSANAGLVKGDKVTGDVILSASGENVRVEYDFGAFAQLKKTGLFESAVYEFSDDNIEAVTLTTPVENQDSIEIRFN